MIQIKNSSLRFKQGSSDKVYNTEISQSDMGYFVNFSYGRYGGTLKTGTKTSTPTSENNANKIYEKLIKSKMSKGYTASDGMCEVINVISGKVSSNISCQLLNVIGHDEALVLCASPSFILQKKFDGERRLIEKRLSVVKGINRKGFYVSLSEKIKKQFENIEVDYFIVDGEEVGNEIHLFDILMINDIDITGKPYEERYDILCGLSDQASGLNIVKSHFSEQEKLDKLKYLEDHNKEGAVFKRLDAPYTSGRPNSGGSQLKRKFYADCSVIVSAHTEGKRSVSMQVIGQDGQKVSIGKVTIPPNHTIPSLGSIVNVSYLYAYREGSLFQPIFDKERNDLDVNDCSINQLKYKAA